LIQQLEASSGAVEYCKNKLQRVNCRVGALAPSLELLQDTLISQATTVEQRALQSLNNTMLILVQVIQAPCACCDTTPACFFK
jgi:hypothetical protein